MAMITIRYCPETGYIMLKGHARAQENAYGHDLVCAAASALIHTYHYAAERSGYIMEIESDKGYKMVRPDPDCHYDSRLLEMQRTVLLGFEYLARDWTDHIRMERVVGDYAQHGW